MRPTSSILLPSQAQGGECIEFLYLRMGGNCPLDRRSMLADAADALKSEQQLGGEDLSVFCWVLNGIGLGDVVLEFV